MISRRGFLSGMGLMTISGALSGCSDASDRLEVLLLRGSIPPQLISHFRRQTKGQFSFQSIPQIKALYQRLQEGQLGASPSWWDRLQGRSRASIAIADLASLGDYWLTEAIRNKLIQPIDISNIPGWKSIPEPWQRIVKRDRLGNLQATGEIWGAPYLGGSTLIAYRRDKLKGREPKDWSDLWRKDVKRKISMVDQPREVIGLTLKSLGHSYNTGDLAAIASLKSRLQALQEQVLYYSSTDYLQPLILGDSWLAVGWSNDILPLLKNNPDIGAVMPLSGTSLWTNLWVRPTHPTPDKHLPIDLRSWIDYCWQPAIAEKISRLTKGISPILLNSPPSESPHSSSPPFFFTSDPAILARSEFIEPLTPPILQKYNALWQEMREIYS